MHNVFCIGPDLVTVVEEAMQYPCIKVNYSISLLPGRPRCQGLAQAEFGSRVGLWGPEQELINQQLQ